MKSVPLEPVRSSKFYHAVGTADELDLRIADRTPTRDASPRHVTVLCLIRFVLFFGEGKRYLVILQECTNVHVGSFCSACRQRFNVFQASGPLWAVGLVPAASLPLQSCKPGFNI